MAVKLLGITFLVLLLMMCFELNSSIPTNALWTNENQSDTNVPVEVCQKEKPKCTATGGTCLRDESEVKCNCPADVSYDEEIGCKDVCEKEKPKCTATGGICLRDESEVKCNCPADVIYDEEIGCKATCESDADCKVPNKKCDANKFCECQDGYEGDDCKVVTGCKVLMKECDKIEKECIFHKDAPEKATCKCSDGHLYDRKENQCKATCEKDADCEGSNRQCNADKFCECQDGYEGNDCKVVTGCKLLKEKCDKIEKKCIFDEDAPGKATCKCDDGHVYDTKKNQCKADYCKEICGEIKCEGNKFVKEEIKCVCPNEDQHFDEEDKTCKIVCKEDKDCKNGGSCEENGSLKVCSCLQGTEGPFCEKVLNCKDLECGKDASCIFDSEAETPVCHCNDDKLLFDKKDKKCKLNKCREHCGVQLGKKNGVLCEGDPFGVKNVSCKCTNKTMDFFQDAKVCKVNKCKEKCGFNSGKNGRVLCSGEPFGEGEVSCSCEDESLIFEEEERDCKRKMKLTFLATFAISLSVMIGFVLILTAVVCCRKKMQKPRYSMKLRGQSISFESALYDASNDSLSLFETRN